MPFLRRRWALCLMTTLAIAGSLRGDEPKPGQKPDEKPPAGKATQAFSSKEGKFNIAFPMKEKPFEKSMDIPAGDQKVKLYLFGADEAKYAYLVSYCDYPKEAIANADRNDMLDNVMAGILKGMNGKEKSTAKIKIEGLNARETAFELPELKAHGKARAFLVENRLYQIIGFEATDKPVHVNDFLKSFRLVKDAK